MKKLFVLFSHGELTKEQVLDAEKKLEGIKKENIVYFPKELLDLWKSIPTDLVNLDDYLNPFKEYIMENGKINDFVLIAGEPGATCKMVEFCKLNNLRPLYSTTERVSVEKKDNNGKIIKTNEFKHILFRRY